MEFACPACSGSIDAGPEWAGHTTQCPHCGTQLVVPGEPPAAVAQPQMPQAAATGAYVPPAPGYPPGAGGAAAGYYTGPKTEASGAMVSLICGLLGVFPLAIIFGHIARGQVKTNPNKTGGGYALAGLILGYVGLVVTLVSWLIVLPLLNEAQVKAKQNKELQRAIGIAKVLRVYSLDAGGAYPESLQELAEGGHIDPKRILYTRIDNGESVPFIFFNETDAMSPANHPLIAAPEVYDGVRVVVFCDASGRILPEEEYQALAKGKARVP